MLVSNLKSSLLYPTRDEIPPENNHCQNVLTRCQWCLPLCSLSSMTPPHLSSFRGLGTSLLLCLRSPIRAQNRPLPVAAPRPSNHPASSLSSEALTLLPVQETVFSLSPFPPGAGTSLWEAELNTIR